MKLDNSINEFKLAQEVIPGGVNSPVRAFKSVHCSPIFISKAKGSKIFDIDGNEYIDFVSSWGPMILGHAHDDVLYAINTTAANGTSYGAPTRLETLMAQKIISMIPSVEKVRMVNSGTEATMSAIRVARGFTGRDKIVKFEGCYHGHCDALLVKAGSGALTLGEPDSLGVPASVAQHTVTLEYNNIEQVEAFFAEAGDQVAAVIVEPIAGNMGCVPPVPGFLEALRAQTTQAGALLIFDEVMTGFRVNLGGAQAQYNVVPDLTTLGKVIGGGMPVGAFGGRRDVMSVVAPLGGVYQAGTLSGNPIAMTAGLATLSLIEQPGFFETLSIRTDQLVTGLKTAAADAGIDFSTNQVGGMFGFFFAAADPVTRFSEVMDADAARFNLFFNGMLELGINLAPSPFESGFVSGAHTEQDIEQTLDAASKVFATLS